MRIGVAATPDVAIPTLDWLLNSEHDLELVITQPDKPAGRGRVLTQTDVAQWAAAHEIATIKPTSPTELMGVVDGLDLVLTIGYGVLLPEQLLSRPRFGFLNLHFSLLPAYRGAAPAQRALLNGEDRTGVTVFALDKGMDTGPIYSQIELAVDPSWRSVELLSELAKIGVVAVEQAFSMISKNVSPAVQHGKASLAPKITKLEAKLDFNSQAIDVINAIRAFTYAPGAWTLWRDESFKVSAAQLGAIKGLKHNEIKFLDNHLYIGCADDTTIELLTVTPSGKKEMPALEWARGAHLQGGEFFG